MMQNFNVVAFQSRNLNIQVMVGSGKAGPTIWYFKQILNVVHFCRN